LAISVIVIPSISLIIGNFTIFHKLFEYTDTLLNRRIVKFDNIFKKSMIFIQTHIDYMFELCDNYSIG
jgi:hypothetical protein